MSAQRVSLASATAIMRGALGAGPQRLGIPQVLLGLAFGAAIVALIAGAVDGALARIALAELLARPALLALFVAGYASAFLLRALAWRRLLAAPGAPMVSAGRLFAILHAALLANHALPLKAGELVRPHLAWRAGAAPASAVASTLVARVMDLASLLLIAVVLLAGTTGAIPAATLAAPAALVLAAALLLAAMRSDRFTPHLPTPLVRGWCALSDALRATPAPRIAAAAGLTLVSWLLESVALLTMARAAGVSLGPTEAAAATAFTILFQVVHLTPGGIGVYELSMTAVLGLLGVPLETAITLAALTHGLKFAYAFTVGAALTLPAVTGFDPLALVRGTRGRVRRAGRLEIVAARLWNVLNEGKPFTPVFVTGVLVVLGALRLEGPQHWWRLGVALLALLPLFAVFFRYDFPLRLRAVLWLLLALALALVRFIDPLAVGLVLTLYVLFTVVLWGTVYYHLRIGTPWTNFARFWRLVLENPDPTSGNFLEQAPKALTLVLLALFLVDAGPSVAAIAVAQGFTAIAFVAAVLTHQWWFTWPPGSPQGPTRLRSRERIAARVILVVIDGCRADRLREAHTPFLDRLAAEGVAFSEMQTVYPARTVTCFTSMLTGAAPRVHGMRSNFVPSLGAKCESIFDVLRRSAMRGRIVGIAHLIDSFGEEAVASVTAVMHNDDIDHGLIERAKRVLREESPELLVLQTLSVDQTGHARGSWYPEYLAKIEETDRLLEQFFDWCAREGYLDGATVLVTSDHGQGRGIGGHGHLTEPERRVPGIAWGAGVPGGLVVDEPRSLLDVAPTIAYYLGVDPPDRSVGQVLLTSAGAVSRGAGPLAVIVPAYNEAETLPLVLERIAAQRLRDARVIVVDDGSTDGTAELAEGAGAVVVRHGRNRGLGAALRSGLAAAREIDARAAIYLDADLEYDPAEIPLLLDPIERGEADYVLGSRFLGAREAHPRWRGLANRLFTLLLSVLAGRRISDGQTGFRGFSHRALEVAEIVHDYNYAQVLTLDLLHKGMRLVEVPIRYRHRERGRSFIGWQYVWRVPLGMAREVLGG